LPMSLPSRLGLFNDRHKYGRWTAPVKQIM
jgi:hypothetical protein